MGPDGINPRVLMELVDVMAGPLLIIYQRSWESGEVPADWKLATAIPVYRKGVREDSENYRPLSLTSVPGKILEKIILVYFWILGRLLILCLPASFRTISPPVG